MARSRDDDEYTDEPPPPRRKKRRDEDDDYDDRPRARRRREEEEEDEDYPRARRHTNEDLRSIAWSQKMIIFCILANLGTLPVRFALDSLAPEMALVGWIILAAYYAVVALTASVFIFMLAVKVYESTGTGVFMGILTLIPCVGLIVLLIVNGKATEILKKHKVRVGLLGARMSDLDER